MLTTLTAPAFAGTWYIEDGDITISAGESGNNVTQNENTTKNDPDTIITNREEGASSHTVTIDAKDKDDKVEVTLKDVNIDTSKQSKAAVSVTGSGDTTIELDGDNELKSGDRHAGLEHNQTVDSEGNVTSGKLTAQCTVKCSWKAAEKPAESAKPSAPSQSAQDKLPSQEEKAVDLAAFFTKIEKDYDMSSMEAADGELIENCYPGLSAIQTQQLAVYMCMMNPSPNGDVVLVQVKDSKDVDAVKAILQARIQYMVGDGKGPGGAWYPEPTEMWENNSRIVTHGNYVMMVADFECDNIVNAFNALF